MMLAPTMKPIAACKFDRALDHVWDQVRGLNQFIDQEKPWEIAKSKDDRPSARSIGADGE